MDHWPFRDPPNVAVIVNRKIIKEGDWIAYVSHDLSDGGWQFHNSDPGPVKEADAAVVSLSNIVNIDSSVGALADLPLGWCAWRDSKESEWHREKSSRRADR